MWQFIVDHTNEYAAQKIAATQLRHRSLYRTWQPVTVEEMKGFVAVILNMGIIR